MFTLFKIYSFKYLICQPITSYHGLLTTVGYKFGPNNPAVYALEVSKLLYCFIRKYLISDVHAWAW